MSRKQWKGRCSERKYRQDLSGHNSIDCWQGQLDSGGLLQRGPN